MYRVPRTFEPLLPAIAELLPTFPRTGGKSRELFVPIAKERTQTMKNGVQLQRRKSRCEGGLFYAARLLTLRTVSSK